MRGFKFLVLAALSLFAACSACGNSTENSETTLVTVTTAQGSYPFTVEIADSTAERAEGLMNRTDLTDDNGMIFVWEEDTNSSFWMKDTPTSLDILFVDANRSIVTIQADAVPLSEESISPTSPYRYVLEVKAGFTDRSGVAVGDTVEMEL
ncbi:MAG: DUF192 domain-containing protein [Deltaproteobacteria bacterium]|nr:DUF192 domain-containing protein [Deltaproteobacteria bacterium]